MIWSVPGARPRPINPARVESFESAELLCDDERRMIRKHYPARADADSLRAARDVTYEDRGRRAGDARYVMVLGQPEAAIIP